VKREWQETVAELCKQANRIVLLLSFTSGLNWELREVLRSGGLSKLMVIVPPELPHQSHRHYSGIRLADQYAAFPEFEERWRNAIKDTPLERVDPDLLRLSLVIRFDEENRPILVMSNDRNGLAYLVALRIAALPIARLTRVSSPTG
jgi:hypothetical protein